jgi:hypothetical protein
MTTIERLDNWKAGGVISEDQHVLLSSYVRHERFSVFVEISGLLYLGVLFIIGGLTWTFRDYIDRLGDIAILSILLILMAVSFGYCAVKTLPYSNDEVESPTFAFDYVLYFGCLVFSTTLGFLGTRFGLFGGAWDTHLLIASLVFGGLAYRFDNRFVLSLAMSTLAAFLGLKLSIFDTQRTDVVRVLAMMYGAFLLGVGWTLHRANIKRHFFDTYLQLGANAILLANAWGAVEGPWRNAYLLSLLILSGVSVALGIKYRRFAFVLYGTVYGYFGLTARVMDAIGSPTFGLFWMVVTGSMVLITLVAVARRFGRDEQ